MTDKDIKSIVKEYIEKRDLYKEFSSKISELLRLICEDNSIRYYTITSRAKDIEKLKDKFLKKNENIKKRYKKLTDCEDLAGVRIVFFVESEKTRIVNYLHEFLKIKDITNKYKEDGYKGSHYIIEMKAKRSNMIEYKKFKGLKCEIQLTTIFFHGRSEFEHDTIYKPNKLLKQKYGTGLDKVNKKCREIMKKYLNDASIELENVWKRYQKLERGINLIDFEDFDSLMSINSNKDLYDKLSEFKEYIFNDTESAKNFYLQYKKDKNLSTTLKKIVGKSVSNNIFKEKDIFGNIVLYDFRKITLKLLDLIFEIMLLDIDVFLEICFWVDIEYHCQDVSNAISKGLTTLSSYDFGLIYEKKLGYSIQRKLIDSLLSNSKFKIVSFDINISIIKELLSLNFKGTKVDGNKIIRYNGSLFMDENLKYIRNNCISILFHLYGIDYYKQNFEIIKTLNLGNNLPHNGGYDDELVKTVCFNSDTILKFYIDNFSVFKNEEKFLISQEINLLKVNITSYKYINKNQFSNLVKLINADSKFYQYKLITGNIPWDYKKQDFDLDKRDIKLKPFVESLSLDNYEDIKKLILSIIEQKDTSIQGLNDFMYSVGENNYYFAEKLLNDIGGNLNNFIIGLIGGMLISNRTKTEKIIETLINQNKNINDLPGIYLYKDSIINISLLEKIFSKIIKSRDIDGLNNFLKIISIHYNKNHDILIKKKFRKYFWESLKFIYNGKVLDIDKFTWESYSWPFYENMIKDSTKKEWKIFLNLFIQHKNWSNTHISTSLVFIGEKDISLIFYFLKKRLEYNIECGNSDYEAIPFYFDKNLANLLHKNIEKIITELFDFIDDRNRLFIRNSQKLISEIIGNFTEKIEKLFIEIIRKDKKNIDKILDIIMSYKSLEPRNIIEGENAGNIYNLFKEIIKQIRLTKNSKNNIMHIMSFKGSWSGVYGLVNVLKEYIIDIDSWKNDRSKKIRDFYLDYKEYLEDKIRIEEKHANEREKNTDM